MPEAETAQAAEYHEVCANAAPSVRVTLDISSIEPITGQLTCERAEEQFTGWLELTQALERSLLAVRRARAAGEKGDLEDSL